MQPSDIVSSTIEISFGMPRLLARLKMRSQAQPQFVGRLTQNLQQRCVSWEFMLTVMASHVEPYVADTRVQSFPRRHDFYGTAVTEVQITSDFQKSEELQSLSPPAAAKSQQPLPYDSTWATRTDVGGPNSEGEPRVRQFEAVCSSNRRPAQRTALKSLRTTRRDASLKLKRLDPVKMGYLRTSFIFGLAVLITWIPSSIDRLYSLTHNGRISFQWSVASGCVLPLQGVWNGIIYFMTSWSVLVEEVKLITGRSCDNKNNNSGFRNTLQLETRLDRFGDRRDTFERCQIPSAKVSGPAQLSLDDDFQLNDHSSAEIFTSVK